MFHVSEANMPISNTTIPSLVYLQIAADDLREVFSPFGELTDVQLAPAPMGGAHGSAYVTFLRPQDARDAQVNARASV